MSFKTDRKEYRMEAVITASPHAFDLIAYRSLSADERGKIFRKRVNELVKPYTVVDVLTEVYHRSFANDFSDYIGSHTEEFARFKKSDDSWAVSRVWVNECRLVRPESIFDQPKDECFVDILTEVRIRIEEVKKGNAFLKNFNNIKGRFRLRYMFDFRPCHLTCHFIKVVIDEKDSLLSLFPDEIRMDKYLLPVLKTADDYKVIAERILEYWMPEQIDSEKPFDPFKWLEVMHMKLMWGAFPENGAQGEYFYDFGQADIIDPETGIIETADITPGTIVLNYETRKYRSALNVTACHEGVHHRLDFYYLMLQKTHGHDYCSYLCKKYQPGNKQDDRWSAVDIMELQANKLPGYLFIQDVPGKAYADMLMKSYGGVRNLENMKRLVKDMADHFGTTLTTARSRLVDLGYNEARGISRFLSGKRVPDYLSNLFGTQTYSIEEADAIKEYINNPAFQKVIDTGLFIYADGHYCLNTKQYVFVDQYGIHHLTYEARMNMADCCIPFEVRYQHKPQIVMGGILFKNEGRGNKTVSYQDKHGKAVTTAEGMALRRQIEREQAAQQIVKKTFNQMTVDLMKSRKVSIPRLADLTGMSPDTIKNMRNDPDRVFDIREIVVFCIALHLPPEVSDVYIAESLSKFRNSIDMGLYRYALREWYTMSVPIVNRKLVEAGAVPLTNLVDGFDENGIMIETG